MASVPPNRLSSAHHWCEVPSKTQLFARHSKIFTLSSPTSVEFIIWRITSTWHRSDQSGVGPVRNNSQSNGEWFATVCEVQTRSRCHRIWPDKDRTPSLSKIIASRLNILSSRLNQPTRRPRLISARRSNVNWRKWSKCVKQGYYLKHRRNRFLNDCFHWHRVSIITSLRVAQLRQMLFLLSRNDRWVQ